jgi:hypothetical protein
VIGDELVNRGLSLRCPDEFCGGVHFYPRVESVLDLALLSRGVEASNLAVG